MKDTANNPSKSTKQSNYELKSDAVEALVNADTEETPQFSEEELRQYRTKKGISIPEPVKILALKAWFGGVVCYFILWGLGLSGMMPDLDQVFILGVVLGMVTDILTNNILRFMEEVPGGNNKWLLVTRRGMAGFGANLLMSIAIMACVYLTYDLINSTAAAISGDPEHIFLGVEPIGFGLMCMGYDMLFIWIKGLIRALFQKLKARTQKDSE